jgi:hypothetical protein
VDTYGAQHVTNQASPIIGSFALIGLYLHHQMGYTGKRIKQTHLQLARLKRSWPQFEAPAVEWPLLMLHPLEAPAGPERDAAILEWSASVWKAWEPQHAEIETLVDEVLAAIAVV